MLGVIKVMRYRSSTKKKHIREGGRSAQSAKRTSLRRRLVKIGGKYKFHSNTKKQQHIQDGLARHVNNMWLNNGLSTGREREGMHDGCNLYILL